jgi:hypothetical protein
MAIGDLQGGVSSGTINVETKTFTYQPAAGEVWKVRGVYAMCTDATASAHTILLKITDGASTAIPLATSTATANPIALLFGDISWPFESQTGFRPDWAGQYTNHVKTYYGDGAGSLGVSWSTAYNSSMKGTFLIDNTTYLVVTISSAGAGKKYEIFVDAVEVRSA